MPTGYSWAGSTSDEYDKLVDSFRWDVPEEYNIATECLRAASTQPDATAVIHVDDTGERYSFSYRELADATEALATWLDDRGYEPGDRVGLCFPQCPELLVAHLAAYKCGIVTVPLSLILGADSFEYSLRQSGADGLLIDEHSAERFSEPIHKSPLDHVTSIPVEPAKYDGALPCLGGFGELVDGVPFGPAIQTAPDDPGLIVYTSGTSGKPKGVVQHHQYLLATLPGYQLWFEVLDDTHDERVWTPAEWAWAGALFDVVFPTLAMGGTVVSQVRRKGFDADVALNLMALVHVTRAFMPATSLRRIRQEGSPDEYDLDALSVILAGGEYLSWPLLEWAQETLEVTVNESYGLTEANSLVGNCQQLFPVREGSMGRQYPGHDLRLAGADNEPVPSGEIGEIQLASPDPSLFARYWDDAEGTRAQFTADGWFKTGDLALQDDEGYYFHKGRADNVIITSGYRVSPREVEEALVLFPAVAAALVGGVPDDDRGEAVKAVVVLTEDGRSMGDEIRDKLQSHVRDICGAHKVPRQFEFVDALPETRTGKVDRARSSE